ncbi:hypothetical protein [Stieleria varia]|nr:hypothetical protein [Stieleria varia]
MGGGTNEIDVAVSTQIHRLGLKPLGFSHDSQAAPAAETFVMQRMIQTMANTILIRKNRTERRRFGTPPRSGMLRGLLITVVAVAASVHSHAQMAMPGMGMPQMGMPNMYGPVTQADIDYDASGFVTPAGMVAPGMVPGGPAGGVMPVGFMQSSCDNMPGCDGMGGCDGGCGDGSCGAGYGGGCDCGGGGGLLGKLRNGGCGGCSLCLFCGGQGCSACANIGNGQLIRGMAGMLAMLRPYSEASLCNQRWYDLSGEVLFLDRNVGSGNGGVLTSRGISGPAALSVGDINADSLEAGMRLSAALIFGAGSNLEATYMGGNEWDDTATAFATPGQADLFSFISDFGTNPGGPAISAGFDDTDRSLTQSIRSQAVFHSGELNYRRRTVWPCCRFQGSWLAGLRYMRYDDSLLYQTVGLNNNGAANNGPRFFSSDGQTKNKMFGAQLGFDFWWNVRPGISLGLGGKGAWVQNNVDRRVLLNSNSTGSIAVDDGDFNDALIGDAEFKMVYRLTHSITFRSAYYVTAADRVAFGSADVAASQNFLTGAAPVTLDDIQYDSLVLQGFSFGAEYMW